MIRSFLYVDEYKLASFASQLFGGLPKLSIHYGTHTKAQETRQKGPVGSGRELSDESASGSSSEEHRVIYDDIYAKFEDELQKREALTDINALPKSARPTGFVRVTGMVEFIGVSEIAEFFNNFNSLGKAIATVDDPSIMKLPKREKEALVRSTIDKHHLKIDAEYAKEFTFLLTSLFSDHFELRVLSDEPDKIGACAFLNRMYFREHSALVLRKFSRFSTIPLTIVGLVTSRESKAPPPPAGDIAHDSPMRPRLRLLSKLLSEWEQFVMGRGEGEIIIDPVAVYQEIPHT